MFRNFGWPEALIILAVILIVFGVGKLPQVGGALGKGIREFRRGKAGLLDTPDEEEDEEEEEKPRRKKKTS
jgi:sec-independent protein translocase protein TatA